MATDSESPVLVDPRALSDRCDSIPKVRGIVLEEHAGAPEAVRTTTTTGDNGLQRCTPVHTPLHEIGEAGSVSGGVLAGEVANEVTSDEHLHGVAAT